MKRSILISAVVLFIATGQGFGLIEYKDGGTHNINVSGDVWVDYQSPGMQTTVNVLGGEISNPSGLQAYNNSRINMSGGEVYRLDAWDSSIVNIITGGIVSRLNAWNSSNVSITGGAVQGAFILHDTSSVAISSGTINGYIMASGTSSVAISGGRFRGDHATYLIADESSTVEISGGFVNMLRPNNTSMVAISGGDVDQLSALGNSTTTFYGYDFTGTGSVYFIGNKVIGTGELHGKWLDGTSFTTNIDEHNAGATILAIPEPATIGLLAIGGLMLRRKRQLFLMK